MSSTAPTLGPRPALPAPGPRSPGRGGNLPDSSAPPGTVSRRGPAPPDSSSDPGSTDSVRPDATGAAARRRGGRAAGRAEHAARGRPAVCGYAGAAGRRGAVDGTRRRGAEGRERHGHRHRSRRQRRASRRHGRGGPGREAAGGAPDPRLPQAVAVDVAVQLRRLAGPAGDHRDRDVAGGRVRGGELRPRRRAALPAAPGHRARAARRRVRGPVRPPQDDGDHRRHPLHAVRVHPARRQPRLAVRGAVPHRGVQPVLDPGQGRRRPEHAAQGPVGTGQPALADHHLRAHAGAGGDRLRGPDPRGRGHLQAGALGGRGRPGAVPERADVPRRRGRHLEPALDQRPPGRRAHRQAGDASSARSSTGSPSPGTPRWSAGWSSGSPAPSPRPA